MKPGPLKTELDAIRSRLSAIEKALVTGEQPEVISGTSGQQYEAVDVSLPGQDGADRIDRILDIIWGELRPNVETLSTGAKHYLRRGIGQAINEFYLGANYCVVTDTIADQGKRIHELNELIKAITHERDIAYARLENIRFFLGD